jgi:hypothetical protein
LRNGWEQLEQKRRETGTEPRENNPVCAAHSGVLREGEWPGTIVPLKAGRPGWETKAKWVMHAINDSDLMVATILE